MSSVKPQNQDEATRLGLESH